MKAILYYIIFLNVWIIELCVAQEKSMQMCKKYKRIKAKRKIVPNPFHTFIVGGKITTEKEFPHMVAIGYGDLNSPQFLCGGTLISNLYVLTAAHCTKNTVFGSIKIIRASSTELYNSNQSHQDVKVKNITIHPKYQPPSSYHDIALLRLGHKVKYSLKIIPACLHTKNKLPVQYPDLVALGWGKTNFAGHTSNTLLKVDLTYSPTKKCMKSYKTGSNKKIPYGLQDKFQVCAGGTGKANTCQGDSGGPLQYTSGDLHYIVGVTSFGKACGLTPDPGVYTRVSAYVRWIEKIVWK